MNNIEHSSKLSDYIKIFILHKKIIFLITISVTLISAFSVFFIVDPIYYSSATVKTTVKAGDISSILGGGAISGMDLGELAGGGAAYKELALYENIIVSRKCLEEVIIKFDIMGIENFKYMYDALKYFRNSVLEIKKDKIAGTMEIGIYDKNPEKAKDIVQHIVNSLNKINGDLNVLNAKNNREFIEKRYNLAKEDLRNSEDSLKLFQDIYGIAPDIQIKAATQINIQLEVEIKSEEIKLDILKKIMSSDQPEVKQQQTKIELLKKQSDDIKNNNNNNKDMLSLKGKPDIAINFMRLTRNVEIQNKILIFLLPMYEQAKIEERKDTPSVLVLDEAFVPDKKAKPARLIIIMVSFFASFFLSFCFFIVLTKWSYYKNNL